MTAVDRPYTTAELCRILGIKSRQTIYNWGARPDYQAPGGRGALLWSAATIERLAAEHGRRIDWEAA